MNASKINFGLYPKELKLKMRQFLKNENKEN